MRRWSRALSTAVLTEDLGLVPSTHSISRSSDILWPLRVPSTQAVDVFLSRHIHIHMKRNVLKKDYLMKGYSKVRVKVLMDTRFL